MVPNAQLHNLETRDKEEEKQEEEGRAVSEGRERQWSKIVHACLRLYNHVGRNARGAAMQNDKLEQSHNHIKK